MEPGMHLVINEISTSAPYSVVFIFDSLFRGKVTTSKGESIAATGDWIAVGTLMEFDGNTRFVFMHNESTESISVECVRRYAGTLASPSRRICVQDAECKELHSFCVKNDNAWIEIWSNDLSEPDVVYISVRDVDGVK